MSTLDGNVLPNDLANETDLIFLRAGPRERLEGVIANYGGAIIQVVEQVGTYQVRFPVNSLEELDGIRKELELSGENVEFVVSEKPTV